jgi:hypothetical protein
MILVKTEIKQGPVGFFLPALKKWLPQRSVIFTPARNFVKRSRTLWQQNPSVPEYHT